MGRRKAPTLLATSLLAGACPGPSHPDQPSGAVAAAPGDADALRADALTHDRFARRTLYTWTTRDQLKEIRRGKRLLLREISPTRGASYVDQVLYGLAQGGDPLAKILWTTTYAKMRFAWHAPWATRLGWEGEDYGRELIRITLEPDAIIVHLSTARGFVGARDLNNQPVPLDKVIATPRRIAAIYFVSEAGAGKHGNFPDPTATYRELVLCNESMIESWVIGGDEIELEAEREAARLEALARHLRSRPGPPPATPPIAAAWARPAPTPEGAYAAALAFANAKYRLDPDALEALAALMRSTPKRAAFTGGTEAVRFPGVGTARGEPRVFDRRSGTYGGGTYAGPGRP